MRECPIQLLRKRWSQPEFLRLVQYRRAEDKLYFLIVAGCLMKIFTQRFEEIFEQLKQVESAETIKHRPIGHGTYQVLHR